MTPPARTDSTTDATITLFGAVSMGTGVMIGAGVFALMGQVASAAGRWFPFAFLGAALVAAVTGYSYVRLAGVFPSAGGIGTFLSKAYGPGPVAATFTMAMWSSMVLNESLVARTFGTYATRLLGISTTTVWVAGLGVLLLIASFSINAAGSRIVSATESWMAVVKIGGLVVFAVACLWVADFPTDGSGEVPSTTIDAMIAAMAIALLAFKGFTTITNTGEEIQQPHRNIGRAITISIAIVTAIYVAVALAVRGNLTLPEIIDARDYSLAQAAEPIFGAVGFKLVAALAVVAAVTSVMASMYSTSRILGMMSKKDQVPEITVGRSVPFGSPPLFVTTAVAVVLTMAFDLTRIAALGAFAYLGLDMVIHWGHWRHLRGDTGARPTPLLAAVALDAVLFLGLFVYRARTDWLVIAAFGVFAVFVASSEYLYTRRIRSTASGKMP